MTRTVSDFIWTRLLEWGVTRVYGYPGDGIGGLIAALQRRENDIEFIQVRHEETEAENDCRLPNLGEVKAQKRGTSPLMSIQLRQNGGSLNKGGVAPFKLSKFLTSPLAFAGISVDRGQWPAKVLLGETPAPSIIQPGGKSL